MKIKIKFVGIALVASSFLTANAVEFKAKNGETVEVKFNGRLHWQYDYITAEDNGIKQASANHFYFRRAYLGAKATSSNGWYGETIFNFARNGSSSERGVNFDKVYIGRDFADKRVSLKLGYLKVPYGYEDTQSSKSIPVIERSAVARFFSDDKDFAGKHTGIHLAFSPNSDFKKKGGVQLSGALVNAAQGEGSRLDGAANANNNFAVFGRAQYKAPNGYFLVGYDIGYQSSNSEKRCFSN